MEKQYLYTERAHFMCPNMHFGMLFVCQAAYQKEKVMETLNVLAYAHPFLRSVIQYDADGIRLYYDIKEVSQISFYEREHMDSIWDDYQKIGEKEWNPFENGLLKVFAYQNGTQMTVLFVAHHLLGDGKCILGLAEEFARYYVGGMKPAFVQEKLIRGFEDLPPDSDLSLISRLLVNRANKQWVKEKRCLDYHTYSEFVKKFSKENPVNYQEYEIAGEEYQNLLKKCRENQVTVNDYLMAKLYLEAGVNKIIIAIDVREKLKCFQNGACGNYSSAAGIICKTKGENAIQLSKRVHEIVRKHIADNKKRMLVLSCYLDMNPTLLDAAATAAMGGFESKAAKFVGAGMFGFDRPKGYSITNLGKTECAEMESVLFIPPASPAAKLTMGVVTLNNTMRFCTSVYQEGLSVK